MSFETDARIAVECLAAWRDAARRREVPVVRQPSTAALAEDLRLAPLLRDGGLHGEALREFLARYLAAATNLHHPGFMAHQVSAPHPSAAIGALVDGFTNNGMAVYEMGPAATTVELFVVNWMLGRVGWTPAPLPPARAAGEAHGGGILTSGGSLANLTALLAARGRVDPAAWEEGGPRDLVLVAPEACHYSLARAAGVIGLGRRALRAAPADAQGRLAPDALAAALDAIAREGKRVLAVVANACSTATGLYDPLREVGALCRERGLWLHVDGAHGASALASDRLRALLDGVHLADSLTWDAHKMLRTPALCAALLVRDHRDLDRAFREEASYLVHDKEQPGVDLLHRTFECTKTSMGLKLFLALAAEGEAGAARHVERQTDLARSAAAALRAAGLEVAVEPESNIVCFRVAGDDALQLRIRDRLLERGRHYVSSTGWAGRRWLRLALMNPDTGIADVEALAAEVLELRAVA